MRIPRIFHPPPLAAGTTVELEPGAYRHVRSVLRLDDGATVELFDGAGGACRGHLRLHRPRRALVALDTPLDDDREPALKLQLALGICKGERMDLAIQKAVELGVSAIQPLVTRRSVVRLDAERADRRVAHWGGIVRSACEQCGRNCLPRLSAPLRLEAWLDGDRTDATALMPTPGAQRTLRQLDPPSESRAVLLIGPEGGLDSQERAAAEACGFTPLRLGPRVLRTETAAIAAVTAVMTLWGDLG